MTRSGCFLQVLQLLGLVLIWSQFINKFGLLFLFSFTCWLLYRFRSRRRSRYDQRCTFSSGSAIGWFVLHFGARSSVGLNFFRLLAVLFYLLYRFKSRRRARHDHWCKFSSGSVIGGFWSQIIS